MNVEQFANELKVPPALLVEQLQAAGVKVKAVGDELSDQDKTLLLDYLRDKHGAKTPKTKITLTRKQTTEIKTADSSGKARTIQVEVRKKRVLVKREAPAAAEAEPIAAPAPEPAAEPAATAAEAKPKAKAKAKGKASVISAEEMQAREAEDRRQAELRAIQESELKTKQEREAAQKRQEEEAAARGEAPAPEAAAKAEPKKPSVKPKVEKVEAKKGKAAEPAPKRGLRVRGALESEGGWRGRKGRNQKPAAASQFVPPSEPVIKDVLIPETITVADLAHKMSVKAAEVIKTLMKMGSMVTINQVLDQETAMIVVEEMGHVAKPAPTDNPESYLEDAGEHKEAELLPRAPVVTVMGHVDHGKTSLLDAIRQTNVVSGEAGGITQHIGAYQVTAPNGHPVTFIDTPGHAAFTAMRARGAKVTDIVVLVVAADDGVMPQTVEAIHHARAAQVPLIVAINKIDKPDAKPERVRTELLQHEVQVESMGGETLEIEVSAKQRTNLDKLLEVIALQAEVLDLKANPDRAAEGSVIEARLDKGRGPVATILVQRGTLHVGDIVVAGAQWGRVRALLDDKGATRETAGPSFPVEILGFGGTPEAGDRVAVVESEARAREITEYRERQRRDKLAARGGSARGSLSDMMSQLKLAGRKEFPLVIKGDVQGSVEAIVAALEKLGTDEVGARVVHAGVGGVSESDISLAEASNAAVIGFNVRAHKEAREAAERAGVEIRYYNIIYNLVDDVKDAMSGLLSPTLRETMLGNATILEVFDISKVGKVAGCRVTDGNVERGANVRLIRDNVVVHEGKLSTLKRFKDEVKEVTAGQECGMAFENYQDMRAGDVIECYRVEEIKRTL